MPTKRTRIYIHVTSELSEPHPLDAEIMKLAGQLRRLIRERASYFNSIAHRDQLISPKHRAAITEKLARGPQIFPRDAREIQRFAHGEVL